MSLARSALAPGRTVRHGQAGIIAIPLAALACGLIFSTVRLEAGLIASAFVVGWVQLVGL